jgi:hypothetical protein
MMVRKSGINVKVKGNNYEREAARVLTEGLKHGEFKRIPGSGALGTNLEMPSLTSDLSGEILGIDKLFRVEAKVGYGNTKNKEVKSITLKKEWLDKVKEEASHLYALPMLICKFDNVHSGVKSFVAFDLDSFIEMMNSVSDMKKELDVVYRKLDEYVNKDEQ